MFDRSRRLHYKHQSILICLVDELSLLGLPSYQKTTTFGTYALWHTHGLHGLLWRQTKAKIQENTKTYIQPVGYPHMAPDSLRRYLQVPPPCQGTLNLCLLPAPPPGSRQFEGQIQSADCRPFYDWLNLNAVLTKYTNTMVGNAYQFVCMYLSFLLYLLTAWEPLEYIFFRRKGICGRNVKNAKLGY